MKYCKRCKIKTNEAQNHCPLCYNELEACDELDFDSLYPKRVENDKSQMTDYFLTRLFSVISISIVCICAFINFVTYSGSLWSLLVLSCIIYLWILIDHTIIGKSSTFEKILYQLIGIIAILSCTDLISGGGYWLLDIVVPSLSLAVAFALIMISLCSKKRQNYVLSFFLFYVILLLVPIITLSCHLLHYELLMQINLLCLILAILGTFIFAFKTLKTEISKKFHL